MLNCRAFVKKLNDKGQSLVEIGLITPLVLIALMVPADFGVAFFTAHLTQNAVREAVRIAVSDPANNPFDTAAANSVKTEALARLPARLTSPAVAVRYYDGGSANCMKFVEVRAQGNYNYFLYQILRLFGASVANSLPITRTSRQRYQAQPANTTSTICTSFSVSSS